MTKVIIIGAGEHEKATAFFEKHPELNSSEIIVVEKPEDLPEEFRSLREPLTMEIKPRPNFDDFDIPAITTYFPEKKSRYQKREFRLPATPIKRKKR